MKFFFTVLSLITLLASCKEAEEPLSVAEPDRQRARLDLSTITIVDRPINGRALNGDSPDFDYLLVKVFSDQTDLHPDHYVGGIFDYFPETLEFDLFEERDYTLELKALRRGTGYGIHEFLSTQNPNPPIPVGNTLIEGLRPPTVDNIYSMYTNEDSSAFQLLEYAEAETYAGSTSFTMEEQEQSIEVPTMNKFNFGVEFVVKNLEQGVVTWDFPPYNIRKIVINYPEQDSVYREYSTRYIHSYYLSNPQNIPTSITFQRTEGGELVGEPIFLFNSSVEYQRLKVYRFEIDLPELEGPELLEGSASWVSFTEESMVPGDTIRIN